MRRSVSHPRRRTFSQYAPQISSIMYFVPRQCVLFRTLQKYNVMHIRTRLRLSQFMWLHEDFVIRGWGAGEEAQKRLVARKILCQIFYI
jgi:hypothetical protein